MNSRFHRRENEPRYKIEYNPPIYPASPPIWPRSFCQEFFGKYWENILAGNHPHVTATEVAD